jgi:hypothetical protein
MTSIFRDRPLSTFVVFPLDQVGARDLAHSVDSFGLFLNLLYHRVVPHGGNTDARYYEAVGLHAAAVCVVDSGRVYFS